MEVKDITKSSVKIHIKAFRIDILEDCSSLIITLYDDNLSEIKVIPRSGNSIRVNKEKYTFEIEEAKDAM